jgi:hypothetical protein
MKPATLKPSPVVLPELLSIILGCLADEGDYKTLFSAIRVNRNWFQCGIFPLWREPFPSAIVAVGKDRRQFYASKISSLTLGSKHRPLESSLYLHNEFQRLQFPMLKCIRMIGYWPGNWAHAKHYLEPSVQELLLCDGNFGNGLLDLIAARCRGLRRLSIYYPTEWVTVESFTAFIKKLPSLEALNFHHETSYAGEDIVMARLASHENLKYLHMNCFFRKSAMDHISSHIPNAFQSLKILGIHVFSARVKALVQMVPQLTHLYLGVKGGEDILGYLSQLTNLVTLRLEFVGPQKLSAAGIKSLDKLRLLRDLYVEGAAVEAPPEFTEGDFDRLLSHLPDLESLAFCVRGNFSSAVLKSVAKHCPNLECCKLNVRVDLRPLDLEHHREVMFPKLRVLWLVDHTDNPGAQVVDNWQVNLNPCPLPNSESLLTGRIFVNREVIAHNFVRLLIRHFPKPCKIQFDTSDRLWRSINAVYEAETSRRC